MADEVKERPPTPFPESNIDFKENNDEEERITSVKETKLTIVQEEEEVGSVKSINKRSQDFINTYITLKSKIKDDEITAASVVHILKLSMELVEDLKDVKGEDQRDFAVSLVREIIDKSKLTQQQKENCLLVIDFGVLDNVVDFVVDATTGKVNINKVKKKVSKLFSCCK